MGTSNRSLFGKVQPYHTAAVSTPQRADDATRFDLEVGDAPAIARCRARFGEHLPLLKAMLAFDAAQRPTMRALLLSPLFAPLRATGELRADAVFATFARRDDAAPIPDV